MTTTVEQLKDLGEELLVKAKEALIENGRLLPCVFVICDGTCTDIMAIPNMPGPNDKHNAYHTIAGHIAKRNDVEAVICLNDSYVRSVKSDPDTWTRSYKQGDLSKDPEAHECIVLGFKGPSMETHVMSVPYRRNDVGNIEWFDIEGQPKGWFQGAEFNLMPDWWKPHEIDPSPGGHLLKIGGEGVDGRVKDIMKQVEDTHAKYDDISDEALIQLLLEQTPEDEKEFWIIAGDIAARVAHHNVEFGMELYNIGCVHDRQRFLDKLKGFKKNE